MIENIKKSVFKIITSAGTGTGFKISGYDFIVTNFHVVEGSSKVAIETLDKNKFLGKVIMINPEIDLAFVYAPELKDIESTITLDADIDIKTSQKIYIYGFPFGMPFTVTEGIVSSPKQLVSNKYILQTDAAVNPGNSGGPMLSDDGVLLAVTSSKFQNADNIGFGIRHTDLIKELNDYELDCEVYKVKCDSCDTYIIQKTNFCDNCGSNIKKSTFEETNLSAVALFVEDTLEMLGVDPALYRAGKEYWNFHQGSAMIRIFICDEDYLLATTPLNELPKNNLKDLYIYLSSNKVEPFMLGISENKIYISYRIHLSDIFTDKKDEIKETLKTFILKADEMDDFFYNEFSCPFAIESKEV